MDSTHHDLLEYREQKETKGNSRGTKVCVRGNMIKKGKGYGRGKGEYE